MELTVAAIPVYFGSIGAEYAWLRRHAEERGETAGDYEWRDTIASLTMGVGSLVAPLVAQKLLAPVTPGRGRYAKALIALATGGAAVATVADLVTRSGSSRTSEMGSAAEDDLARPSRAERRSLARKVAGSAGVAAVLSAGLSAATSWATFTTADRLWSRRRGRDAGNGPLALATAILVWDFIYYWNHRFMHESRYMWAVHVVHHSSERYNLSTALRQPVADALGTFLPQGVLCLAGDPYRGDRSARTRREGLQHPFAPPCSPREQPPVHRPEPRKHPHHLGPAVRHVRARARARRLRADTEHQHLQPSQDRGSRASGDDQ
jgi:hypothetical protein